MRKIFAIVSMLFSISLTALAEEPRLSPPDEACTENSSATVTTPNKNAATSKEVSPCPPGMSCSEDYRVKHIIIGGGIKGEPIPTTAQPLEKDEPMMMEIYK